MNLTGGVAVAVAGITIGFLGALALTRFLRSTLFGVSTTDAWTHVAVALGLGVVAFLASYLPARSAAGHDPTAALRAE